MKLDDQAMTVDAEKSTEWWTPHPVGFDHINEFFLFIFIQNIKNMFASNATINVKSIHFHRIVENIFHFKEFIGFF